jgi:hypothetical protein
LLSLSSLAELAASSLEFLSSGSASLSVAKSGFLKVSCLAAALGGDSFSVFEDIIIEATTAKATTPPTGIR